MEWEVLMSASREVDSCARTVMSAARERSVEYLARFQRKERTYSSAGSRAGRLGWGWFVWGGKGGGVRLLLMSLYWVSCPGASAEITSEA